MTTDPWRSASRAAAITGTEAGPHHPSSRAACIFQIGHRPASVVHENIDMCTSPFQVVDDAAGLVVNIELDPSAPWNSTFSTSFGIRAGLLGVVITVPQCRYNLAYEADPEVGRVSGNEPG